MGKTSIDELLKAIKTVGILQDAVSGHSETIAAILKRLDQIEASLAVVNDRLNNGGRVGG